MRSKNTIGQLKGRFQSLRSNPTVILGKEMHTLVVLWIWSSALHNMLHMHGYDYSNWEGGTEDPDIIVFDETPEGNNITLGYNDSFARRKRKMIKIEVLKYHGYGI